MKKIYIFLLRHRLFARPSTKTAISEIPPKQLQNRTLLGRLFRAISPFYMSEGDLQYVARFVADCFSCDVFSLGSRPKLEGRSYGRENSHALLANCRGGGCCSGHNACYLGMRGRNPDDVLPGFTLTRYQVLSLDSFS